MLNPIVFSIVSLLVVFALTFAVLYFSKMSFVMTGGKVSLEKTILYSFLVALMISIVILAVMKMMKPKLRYRYCGRMM